MEPRSSALDLLLGAVYLLALAVLSVVSITVTTSFRP
jgi:hypothetical protein